MPSEKLLKKALHDRIQADVPPAQFDEEEWSEVSLGDYYRSDIIKIDIMVYTTTEQALNKEGRTLPDRVRRDMLSGISINTTPKAAVPLMFDAATRAIPISLRTDLPEIRT